MRRLNIILFVLFSTLWISGKSQLTYKFVDSVSYRFYNDERWNELTLFGANAAKDGFDYYYLNLRVGIANFNVKDYDKAIIYFNRALENNSMSEVAKEYLFWSYLNDSNQHQAKIVYETLLDETKSEINYKSSKIVNYIAVEAGYRFSSDRSTGGNITYLNAGIGSMLSTKWNMYQAYTYISQNLVWGSFNQNEYYLNNFIELKNDWSLNIAFHYAHYKSEMDYDTENVFHTPPPRWPPQGDFSDTTKHSNYIIKGEFVENDLVSQINMIKKEEHFVLSPHLGVYNRWVNPNYYEYKSDTINVVVQNGSIVISDTTYSEVSEEEVNEKYSDVQGVIGFDISYYSDKVTFGLDMFVTIDSDQSHFNMMPYLGITFSERFSIWAYYFNKKAGYGMSLFNAAQMINTYDKLARFNLTGNIGLSDNATLYISYQQEKIEDGPSLINYKLYSILAGVKIKL